VRVLLDVNILVRANEKSHGPARRLLLELVGRGETLLTSTEILIELGRALRYPRVQTLFNLTEEQVYEYIQFLKDVCQIVPLNLSLNFPIRDSSDNVILRTAVIGEADFLCTLDRDFYASEITLVCAALEIVVLDDIAMLQQLRS
jgi:putative PIN family toxin of toxin-antitoxin system